VRTAVTDLLGLEQPVLQAPMASVATPELAAAVSRAGGLGALGSAMLAPDELRRQAAAVRERTDLPFQLNFFCHAPPRLDADVKQSGRAGVAGLYEELGLGEPPEPTTPPIAFDVARLEALLDIRPPVVSFHFGVPEQEALTACREAGMRILASATTVSEARELERRGVDAVVAQGAEAGGHRGSFLVEGDDGPVGTLALVPQVVDAVGVPVIAAGGIADGRGLAAALVLGAGAAQVGTAFIGCPETAAAPAYGRALESAEAEATTITRAFSGRPARALRNRMTAEVREPLPYPAQLSLTGPLMEAADGLLPMWAGQGAALARAAPAAEVVADLVEGAESRLAEPLLSAWRGARGRA
jgi:nitronate monooxygenase